MSAWDTPSTPIPPPTPPSAASRPEPTTRQWLTRAGGRKVLAIVDTVTYGKRLLDILALLEADFRIHVLFTAPPHVFGDGVPHFLARLGSAVLPWESVSRMSFDLALAAGPGGVSKVRAPIVTLPHGAAYIKRITEAGPAEAGIAGLRRRDIMPDGRTLPAALVVPHADELHALERSCPEALPVARVIGDPAYDRIVASLPNRAAYRRALGLDDGRQLVAVVSTWGPHSSFGRIEALLPRLAAELPADRYRVAVLVHPNVWSGHSPWQVRTWLAHCTHRGISVVPPEADWRSVLVASDAIIGDHGSVTLYGTLTGAPILLAASPDQEVNPDSPAATLAVTAPALVPTRALEEQLAYAAGEYRTEDYAAIAARISSEPGRFNRNMRRLIYRLLGLGQPAYEPVTAPLPMPPALDSWTSAAAATPGPRGQGLPGEESA